MTSAISCPLWSSVYECHKLECAFTSPVVVVRLPRHMEGNGVTPIFRCLQNFQFRQRRLESLGHLNALYIYI